MQVRHSPAEEILIDAQKIIKVMVLKRKNEKMLTFSTLGW